jgi:hypothetical protein
MRVFSAHQKNHLKFQIKDKIKGPGTSKNLRSGKILFFTIKEGNTRLGHLQQGDPSRVRAFERVEPDKYVAQRADAPKKRMTAATGRPKVGPNLGLVCMAVNIEGWTLPSSPCPPLARVSASQTTATPL